MWNRAKLEQPGGWDAGMCLVSVRVIMSLEGRTVEGCAQLPEGFRSWQGHGTWGCDVAVLGAAPGL